MPRLLMSSFYGFFKYFETYLCLFFGNC